MKTILLAAFATIFFVHNAHAQDATLSDAQKKSVEQIVRDLLTKSEPDIVVQGLEAYQKKQEEKQKSEAVEALTKNKDRIYKDPNSPVLGNSKGDVTIVEFFDYQCGYCKMAHDEVKKLMAEEKNVKFIHKQFPILGESSTVASKYAMASVKQGKYEKFHSALMGHKGQLSESTILDIAKTAGLDVDKLKKDYADASIAKMVEESRQLGVDLGVRGTPMFIIGDKTYPGALQLDALKAAVAEARTAAKK
jgi:protein-disulfide isomerase